MSEGWGIFKAHTEGETDIPPFYRFVQEVVLAGVKVDSVKYLPLRKPIAKFADLRTKRGNNERDI